jgi:hypothetical protein
MYSRPALKTNNRSGECSVLSKMYPLQNRQMPPSTTFTSTLLTGPLIVLFGVWTGRACARYREVSWMQEYRSWRYSLCACCCHSSEHTRKNGALHYPSHPARVQLGIWDASTPVGTAEWAKGPIDWDKAPNMMTAIIRSVEVECPNF